MAIIAKLQSLLGGLEGADKGADRGQTRKRRATDATHSSESSESSAETALLSIEPALSSMETAYANTEPGLTKHETQRLVTQRLGDLARLSRLHPVGKVLQQAAWDCGLACISMIVRAAGRAPCTVSRLAQEARTESVWTIDLAMLLRAHLPHADFTYYTTCVGVNPQHAGSAFYADALDDDCARVVALFSAARVQQTVRVVELRLPLLDLKRFVVHRQYVAVLLVDGAALSCSLCAHTHTRAHRRSRSAAAPRRGMLSWLRRADAAFVGHYVLLIAYVPALDMFVYRDPAVADEFCLAPAATIDTARRREGTDHDCIILKL